MKIPIPLTTFSVALLLGLTALPAQVESKSVGQTATKPSPKTSSGTKTGAETQHPVKVIARKDQISKLDQAGLVKKLEQLLIQIQGLIQSRVDPIKVEDRLRKRSPGYRQVAVTDAPPPGEASKVVPIEGTKVAINPVTPKPQVRLFGDSEKKDLPKGTVLLVEGLTISEEEVKSLEDFYNGYTSEKPGTAREKALEALIVLKSIQAQAKDKLPKLQEEMAAIRKSIVEGGEDFAAVATKRSHGPSSSEGGDIGFFPRDRMVPTFSQAAFGLKLGAVSEAFPSPFGIHILKVTGRKKGATPSQDEVRASHILLLYDKDSNALHGLRKSAMEGQSQIAVLNDEWRKSLPAAYR